MRIFCGDCNSVSPRIIEIENRIDTIIAGSKLLDQAREFVHATLAMELRLMLQSLDNSLASYRYLANLIFRYSLYSNEETAHRVIATKIATLSQTITSLLGTGKVYAQPVRGIKANSKEVHALMELKDYLNEALGTKRTENNVHKINDAEIELRGFKNTLPENGESTYSAFVSTDEFVLSEGLFTITPVLSTFEHLDLVSGYFPFPSPAEAIIKIEMTHETLPGFGAF